MPTCHHGVEGCPCGLDLSPLCAECQGDVELGVWAKREYDARVSHYKKEVDRLGTAVALALTAETWGACREALGAKLASEMREVR